MKNNNILTTKVIISINFFDIIVFKKARIMIIKNFDIMILI